MAIKFTYNQQTVMLRTQKQMQSIPKQILASLIFNKLSQKMTPKTKKNNTPCKNKNEGSEQLDFEDYIKWCYGYRHQPNIKTLESLSNGSIASKITENNFKLFVMTVSGASYHQVSQPSYYDIIIRNKCMYPQLYFCTIQKDIHRTLSKTSLEIQSLRKVLSAYAIRNPNLLYCQGLNILVGNFLLAGFSEVEAFWLLASLIQEILPFDYYVNLKPIVCLNSLLNDLIKIQVPDFLNLCEKIYLETSFFFVSWVVTLYGKGFSRQMSNHLLVLIVLEKQIALVKIALVLIKLIYPKLGKSEEFGIILKEIENLQLTITVSDFQKQYQKIYFNSYLFKILFNQYLEAYPDESSRSFTRKLSLQKKTLPICNNSYEICLHVVQIEKEFRNLRQIQTLKIKTPLDQISDEEYFEKNHLHRRKSKTFLNAEFLEQIKIGRHTHICSTEIRSRMKASNIFVCQDTNEKEEDFENLNQGETRTKDLSPSTSNIYQQLTSQFQVVSMGQQEFEELIDPAQQLKEHQAIIRSLSKRDIDIKLNKFSAKQFIGDFVKNIFSKDKKCN